MLETGDIVGDYQLVKFLGNGQFGEVWLGEKQIKFSKRKVQHALKFLFNKGDKLDIKAVEAEIDTWIEASGHPNVMSVLDMLMHKEHIVIISEYAEGGSLQGWLQKNRGKTPSKAKAGKLMSDILRGIEHLHSRKVVHRDLKPDNILLQGDNPRIADFGLSRIISANTKATLPVGSPVYMSPESFEGNKIPQVDIWSAGIILYELLTGKTPFYGKLDELRKSILNDPLPPLPDDIPPLLKTVVSKALEKKPQNRFQSAKQMRQALEKSLHGIGDEEESREFSPADSQEHITTLRSFTETYKSVRTLTSKIPNEKKNVLWAGFAGVLGIFLILGAVWSFGGFKAANPVQGDGRQTFMENSDAVQTNNLPAAPKIELVEIKSGSFMMGSTNGEADEKPVRRVNLNYNFYLGKYEVTQSQWEEVMGNNPSFFRGDNLPVDTIDWENAKEFIRRLNSLESGYEYRLPSEAEWEYACRAGTTTNFAFGDSLSSGQANIDGNNPFGNALKGVFLQKTSEVGSFAPNKWGLYDMHGNVWEWVEDIYNPNYNGLPSDGSPNLKIGDGKERILRGGSWQYGGKISRSSNRGSTNPTDKSGGIRLAARKKEQS